MLSSSSERRTRTVWALRTMDNSDYLPIKESCGEYLERAGIERMNFNSEKIDVVFAYGSVPYDASLMDVEERIITWCVEACRSGVIAFKNLETLIRNGYDGHDGKYVKGILSERDIKLTKLYDSLGLSRDLFDWKGCVKSWHTGRHELKKIKSKLRLI